MEFLLEEKISKEPNPIVEDNTNDLLNKFEKIIAVLRLIPFDLGGLIIKSRHSETRKIALRLIEENLYDFAIKKIYPEISDSKLLGGIDFSETLRSGKPVYSKSIFDDNPKIFKLMMGERFESRVAAIFAQKMDLKPNFLLLVVDEGIEEEEIPDCLKERISFYIDLNAIPYKRIKDFKIKKYRISKAKALFDKIEIPTNLYKDLFKITFTTGINSMRPPYFTLKVAKALSAFRGVKVLEEKDLIESIGLTLAHKIKYFPPPHEDNKEQNNQNKETNNDEKENKKKSTDIPLELLLDAVKSNLPSNILEKIIHGKGINKSLTNKSGSGENKISFQRGRPLPSINGIPNGRNKIDIIGTLKSAAPWQLIRKKTSSKEDKLKIEFRKSDIQIKKFKDSKNRVIIFTVDASGSLAVGRLAEAKGAIELLLANAYSSRDLVALISFRGENAETLLTPTRSLSKTKRVLGSLPGGGGTPLASGLMSTLKLSIDYSQKGFSPISIILTDGKANINLEGEKGRIKALEDSSQVSKLFVSNKLKSVIIDTSQRISQTAKDLAKNLDGEYVLLPRANAQQLSNVILNKLN